MSFKVNGNDYFLAFAEEMGSWFLIAPTSTGMQRIAVYVDAKTYERPGSLHYGAGSAHN